MMLYDEEQSLIAFKHRALVKQIQHFLSKPFNIQNFVNPLIPNLDMHILLCVLHISLVVLVGRICTFGDHFLYSCDRYI